MILKVLTLIGLPLVFYGVAILLPAQSQTGNSIRTSIEDTESSEITITAEDPLVLLPPLVPPSNMAVFSGPQFKENKLDSISIITQSLPYYGLYPSSSSVLEGVRKTEANILIANNFKELDISSEFETQPVSLQSSYISPVVRSVDKSEIISQDFQNIQFNSYLIAYKSIFSAGALVNSFGASANASLLTKIIFPTDLSHLFRIMTEASLQDKGLSLQMFASYLDNHTWKFFTSFAESRLKYSIYHFPSELIIKGFSRSDFSLQVPFFLTAKNYMGGLNIGETDEGRLGANIGFSFWNTLTSIDWDVFISGKLIFDRSLPSFGSEIGGKLQIYSNNSIVILPMFSLTTVFLPGLQAKLGLEPLLETPGWLSKDLSLTLLHSDDKKNVNMHTVQSLAPEKGWFLSGSVSYTGNFIDNLVSVVTLKLGVNSGNLYRLESSEVVFSEVNALMVDMTTELFFDRNRNSDSNKLLLNIGVVTDLKSKAAPRMKIESTWPLNKLSGIYFRVFGSLAVPPVYSKEITGLVPLEDVFGSVVACALVWQGEPDSQIEVSAGFRRAWESNMYGFIGINYSSD